MYNRLLNLLTEPRAMIKWIMLLIAGYSFVWSMQLFKAGNAYYSAKNDIEIWQLSPEKASTQEVNYAINRINKALTYFPDNALYYQMQGQLFEWKAITKMREKSLYSMNAGSQSKVSDLQKAAASYEKSLKLRPTWSGSWVGLASVKLQQDEIDSVFYEYLENAKRVGPQDAIVHKFIVEFGLKMFNSRSIHYVKTKDLLKHHLDLGIQNPLSRDFVLKTIENYKANETVCRWLRDASYPVRKRIPDCISYD